MPGGINNYVSPFWSFEKSLGGIDGDPSGSLLFEAIHDKGEFNFSAKHFSTFLTFRILIWGQTIRIIKQSPDKGALPMVHMPNNHNRKSPFFLIHMTFPPLHISQGPPLLHRIDI